MKLDMDVCDPADVPHALEKVAHAYRESAKDLRMTFHNPEVGGTWERIAKILDRAAQQVKIVAS
jgi:hypothetical protein